MHLTTTTSQTRSDASTPSAGPNTTSTSSSPRLPSSSLSSQDPFLTYPTPSSSSHSLLALHKPIPTSARPISRRRPLSPPQSICFFAIDYQLKPTQGLSKLMAASSSSRATSPARRSRALSAARPDIPRPPSRCESLLRDTLRKDQEERVNNHRRSSRSRPRPARPRGSSFRSQSNCCDYDHDECLSMRGRGGCDFQHAIASAPRAIPAAHSRHGTGEAGAYPYGSPQSPSPMPPTMQRTRTAPAVPRPIKPYEDEDEDHVLSMSLHSPLPVDRRSLLNSAGHPYAPSTAVSGQSSPKQRQASLHSTQGSVLIKSKVEAKLEEILNVQDQRVGRARNHQRAFSHGVTVNTSAQGYSDDPSPGSHSPNSLNGSSTSNSATDLARAYSTPTSRRDMRAQRSSPSSPPEPLTPPPTPPFNARTASEVCKRMDGYVSFASVQGLGEPPGMDMDAEDNEIGSRAWTKWFRKWTNGQAPEHSAPMHPGRARSDSVSS